MLESVRMQISIRAFVFALLAISPAIAADRITWPSSLPVYDHIVIVIEENKDVEQILSLNWVRRTCARSRRRARS
jgi:hypothetical protein